MPRYGERSHFQEFPRNNQRIQSTPLRLVLSLSKGWMLDIGCWMMEERERLEEIPTTAASSTLGCS